MKTLTVVVHAAPNPRWLARTTEHANAFAEEVALRGVLARVRVHHDYAASALFVACHYANAARMLNDGVAGAAPNDGVMVLRADFERRGMYDSVGACDMWRDTHGTATIFTYTEGGPRRDNGYLYVAPQAALLLGAWTLPKVSPMWMEIEHDRARGSNGGGPCLVS